VEAMPSSLQEELKQTKPFSSLEQEALLSIVRTSALLTDRMELFLRPYGITLTQYNVLRILRGAEPTGLCRNELRDRMLTRMPDVTRLLDRMEEADLVERARDNEDRRMVTSRITRRASQLLTALDPLVAEAERNFFSGIPEGRIQTLIDVLDALRRADV
jgi:DNA-binding MarR family transcriptional regulator